MTTSTTGKTGRIWGNANLSEENSQFKSEEILNRVKIFADKRAMQERRSEARLLCADLVQVCWKDRQGKKHEASALLEDISVSGACLQTEVPVPTGVPVRWGISRREFTGTVRYCEYREIGYFVGVELDSESKWSRRVFKPQHLFDIRRLFRHIKKTASAG